MNPKIPSRHANIGMPVSVHENAEQGIQAIEDDREFAPQDRALEFASQIAARNAELMKRLA